MRSSSYIYLSIYLYLASGEARSRGTPNLTHRGEEHPHSHARVGKKTGTLVPAGGDHGLASLERLVPNVLEKLKNTKKEVIYIYMHSYINVFLLACC